MRIGRSQKSTLFYKKEESIKMKKKKTFMTAIAAALAFSCVAQAGAAARPSDRGGAAGIGAVTTAAVEKSLRGAAKAPKLNKKKLTLTVGQKVALKVKGTSKKAKWKSSNKNVASVSPKGVVKAKKAGAAKITARVGKKKLSCSVKVKSGVKVKKGNFFASNTDLSVAVDESERIKITYDGKGSLDFKNSDYDVCSCEWGSGLGANVATLNVYGIGQGTSTITVTNSEDGRLIIIRVTVVDLDSGPSDSGPSDSGSSDSSPFDSSPFDSDPSDSGEFFASDKRLSLEVDESETLEITYEGEGSLHFENSDSDVCSCEWEDGWDGDVATLDVYGVGRGTSTITITNSEDDRELVIKVTVEYSDISLLGKEVLGEYIQRYGTVGSDGNKYISLYDTDEANGIVYYYEIRYDELEESFDFCMLAEFPNSDAYVILAMELPLEADPDSVQVQALYEDRDGDYSGVADIRPAIYDINIGASFDIVDCPNYSEQDSVSEIFGAAFKMGMLEWDTLLRDTVGLSGMSDVGFLSYSR